MEKLINQTFPTLVYMGGNPMTGAYTEIEVIHGPEHDRQKGKT